MSIHSGETHLIHEYQTLRDEIGRFQNQVASTLEMAILITSGLLAVSFSSLVSKSNQWIILLFPAFLLTPFIFLMIDRVRTTWIIGRYIELFLEPQLSLQWESFNRFLRGSPKSRFHSRFTIFTLLPIMLIQALFPALALLANPSRMDLWAVVSAIIYAILMGEYLYQRKALLNQQDIDSICKAIDEHCIQRAKSVSSSGV